MDNICPITGVVCNNPKIIHIANNGKEYDLCQVCGANNQPAPHTTSILDHFFNLMSIILTSKLQNALKEQSKNHCPTCGTTIDEIAKNSRLGCANCYEYYKKELLPTLIHLHKASKHTGKQPKKEITLEEKIYLLEMQIKQAADQEQYEKAKKLKDELIILKSNPQSLPISD